MKKLFLLLVIAALSLGTYVQTTEKKADDTKKAELKEHVCADACKDGNHVYAHGEKGHVCTEACKAKAQKCKDKGELKEHVCTNACKDGNHVYAHGEKGHVYTDACKKEKEKEKVTAKVEEM